MVTRHQIKRGARVTTLGFGLAALLAGGAQASDFLVEMNKSKALHLPKPVATLMVGNPAVADITIENANLVYVMGKSYGRTNLVALDAEGKPMLDLNISVVSQNASAVTLTRGAGQISYNCTPRCERVPNVGDDPASFDTLMQQMGDAAAASSGAGSAGAAGATGTTR
ncbi:MAG: pilus assembly protein N-terminal domain-containing protein [Parvibaculum sp.]|uniref:pilus assembly protein N-terminal domain-containing protein n=1 Tax=Parvibaculum sp. TaxID=2024848 RepID=UPI0034A02948